MSRSPSAILLPTLAAISCVLCLPILVNHIKSQNLAQSVLVAWIVLENVYNVINPLLWPTNDFEHWWNGIGLCDVESKLRLAGYMGYVSALVCLYRQLAVILNIEQIVLVPSPTQRRWRIATEIALCFGFPAYIMVGHYLVQSGRYYIFAITGCVPILDSSWPSVVLVLIWPGVMWLVAAIYCVVIIHRLIKYRRQVSSILSAPHSQYNQSQFVRLFAMATALILVFLPVALYILVQNLSYGAARNPYSWNRTHDWTNSILFMPSSSGENVGRWIEVVTGFVVFISFGFGRDGLSRYRCILGKLGFGRGVPIVNPPYRPEVNVVIHAPNRQKPASRFGSMSSRTRLILQRDAHNRLASVVRMSSSKSNIPSSPITEVEKEPNNDVMPPQTVYHPNNVQISAQNTRSPHSQSLPWPDKRCMLVLQPLDETICMGSLVPEPLLARVESTCSPTLSKHNQSA